MNDETENNQESSENDQEAMDAWAEALSEQAETEGGGDEAPSDKGESTQAKKAETDYERAELQNLEDEGVPPASEEVNMDVILDVPVTISLEIGRARISIRNLLQLNQGSVVELDRLAGEPLDVMVNGTLIAHGEVVVVNEKYGIRLTDVISPADRVKKLK